MPSHHHRATQIVRQQWAIVVSLIMLPLIAGCDAEPESPPTSAAEAGRSTIGETNGKQKPNPATDVANTHPDQADHTVSKIDETAEAPNPSTDIQTAVAAGKPESADDDIADNDSDDSSPEQSEPETQMASRGNGQASVIDSNANPANFPGGIIPASPTAEPLPGGPRILVPEREFIPDGRSQALRVNYDDLDLLLVLNMGDPIPTDVVDMFPDWLKGLDGKRIIIRGFMYPQYSTRLKGFVLTRDTGVCCFGPNPKVYYLIPVKLEEGTEVNYIPGRPFDVEGTFHINPIDDGSGNWLQLYSISDAKVIE